jgi:catalase
MQVSANGGGPPNYEPNSLNGPVEDPSYSTPPIALNGDAGRYKYHHPTGDDFEQPRALFRNIMNDEERTRLIENISASIAPCRKDIKERLI